MIHRHTSKFGTGENSIALSDIYSAMEFNYKVPKKKQALVMLLSNLKISLI
jgi:hypothetical protein